MGMVKVKNSGNPVVIGGTIVQKGVVTSVDEAALKDYCKATSGSHVFTNFLTVVDEDYDKRKKAEAAALEAKALNDAKAMVLPEVEADLRKSIGKEFKKKIKGLNDKISSLVEEVKVLTAENLGLNKVPVSSPETPEVEEKKEDGPGFVFDQNKHSIEHRGGGSWFVMDQEEKVHGPLSQEDRAKFEELLK